MFARIMNFVDKYKILYSYQYGFRSKRSRSLAITHLQIKEMKSLMHVTKKNYVQVSFWIYQRPLIQLIIKYISKIL